MISMTNMFDGADNPKYHRRSERSYKSLRNFIYSVSGLVLLGLGATGIRYCNNQSELERKIRMEITEEVKKGTDKIVAHRINDLVNEQVNERLKEYNTKQSNQNNQKEQYVDKTPKIQPSNNNPQYVQPTTAAPPIKVNTLPKAPVYTTSKEYWYPVNAGESLSSVLNNVLGKYSQEDINNISKYNNINPNLIEIGQTIRFPDSYTNLHNICYYPLPNNPKLFETRYSVSEICRSEYGDSGLADKVIEYNRKFGFNLNDRFNGREKRRIVYLPDKAILMN